MASKPYEIPWTKVQIGMQIAVDRRGYGFAWRLTDVQAHPDYYEWRVVLGTGHDGPLIDHGGVGINGRFVVVRDLARADREAIAAYIQHIRNAEIAHDRDSRDQLRRQLARRIAALE